LRKLGVEYQREAADHAGATGWLTSNNLYILLLQGDQCSARGRLNLPTTGQLCSKVQNVDIG
jgi:hypothetical protein